MSTEQADLFANYLTPQIAIARKQQQDLQRTVQYKQAGLDFISSCKFASTDDNNVLDIEMLKAKLLEAIQFVQTYHDAL
jgi:hypothetical protein